MEYYLYTTGNKSLPRNHPDSEHFVLESSEKSLNRPDARDLRKLTREEFGALLSSATWDSMPQITEPFQKGMPQKYDVIPRTLVQEEYCFLFGGGDQPGVTVLDCF